MGVASYIKDDKDAIKEVIYQSGIRVKPVYNKQDLEAVGFDYQKTWETRASIPLPAACTHWAIAAGPGPPGSTPASARRKKPTSASNT